MTERPVLAAGWALVLAGAGLLLDGRFAVQYLFTRPGAWDAASALYTARHLLDIGWTLLLFGGFAWVGRRALSFVAIPRETITRGESFLVAVALGEGLTASALLGMGSLGLFRSGPLGALWIALAVGAVLEISGRAPALRRVPALVRRKISWPALLCLAILAAALLRGAIASGAPPVESDSIAYHLSWPKYFLEHGAYLRIPWTICSHYPQNTEMLYVLALALRGDLAAQWINWFHGLLFFSALLCLGRRYMGESQATLGVTLMAVQPVFQRTIGNAMVDPNFSFIASLAFLILLRAWNAPKPPAARLWLLVGLLAGLSASVKLPGIWLALSLTVPAAFYAFRRRETLPLTHYLAGTVLLGSTWYIKNWILTGNPVWPMFGELFSAGGSDLALWRRVREIVTEGMDANLTNYLLFPIVFPLSWRLFDYAVHFIALPFMALALVRAGRNPSLRPLELLIGWMMLSYGSFWFWSFQGSRYLIPIAALAGLLVAAWARDLWLDPAKWRRALAVTALAVCLIPVRELSINNELFPFLGTNSPVPGFSSRERYLLRTLGANYAVIRAANIRLPKESKVLLLGETRAYYLERPYMVGNPTDVGPGFSYASVEDGAGLRGALLEQGITHILRNEAMEENYPYHQEYYSHYRKIVAELIARWTTPLVSLSGIDLYRLED